MTKRLAPVTGPLLVNEPDLSKAWARAVLHVIDHAGLEISPLVLSVTGFDGDGMPGIIGEILTINFVDGYTIDLTPRSKHQSTGTAFFTLIHGKFKGGKQVIAETDKVFYEKLKTADIASFKYNVDQRNRDIIVSKDNAEIIKRIINCVKIE